MRERKRRATTYYIEAAPRSTADIGAEIGRALARSRELEREAERERERARIEAAEDAARLDAVRRGIVVPGGVVDLGGDDEGDGRELAWAVGVATFLGLGFAVACWIGGAW